MTQQNMRQNTVTTSMTKCLRQCFSNQEEKQKKCGVGGGRGEKEGRERKENGSAQ